MFNSRVVFGQFLKNNNAKNQKNHRFIMNKCPTCRLSMDSHSTQELMECCMRQVGDSTDFETDESICLNCKHEIKNHTDQELAECTIAYLKSGISE